MSFDADWLEARQRAQKVLTGAPWPLGSEREHEAITLLRPLKQFREFSLLADIGQRVLRARPGEPFLRRLLVQALIEAGKPSVAIGVAREGLRKLPETHPEWGELYGLIGRAHKQIAIDDGSPTGKTARDALRKGIAAYSLVFRTDEARFHWHGVNLVALLAYANRHGIRFTGAADPLDVARDLIAAAAMQTNPDRWTSASLAEASLALGAMDDVHRHLNNYVSHPEVTAFEVGSTLRQFEQVWELKAVGDPHGEAMLECLRIKYATLPGAHWHVDASSAAQSGGAPSRELATALQAILGHDGPVSYQWYKAGLDRAQSVAAIRIGTKRRIGTGFIVSGRELGCFDYDEAVLVTNFHVVNRNGDTGYRGALRPDESRATFEGVDANRHYRIKEVLWESPVDKHDACVVRLADPPSLDKAIPISHILPVVEKTAQVFVIGHPDGGDLSLSINDTALLDHEGPPNPAPTTGICRVHYRTPTEKGSSGSPVFNAGDWEVIALHHAGGELPAINGKTGNLLANEGISLACIVEAIKAAKCTGSFS